jgi:ribosomal protein L3 glutamine methyltransferase
MHTVFYTAAIKANEYHSIKSFNEFMNNSQQPDDWRTARTAGELLTLAEQALAGSSLSFGHGTDNPRDEAAALVFHSMGLGHDGGADVYATQATAEQCARAAELVARRIATRVPLPYLLGEAWFAGLPFTVDERVLIPRSPVAELIAERFEPWVNAADVMNILEIGTGSGCIAIACALAFPDARVTATDISPAALEVAALNAKRHGVAGRVRLVETDHADGVGETYDLIVTNPPYVPAAEMPELPDEYKHEPELALVSGADGLDSARRILQDATGLLNPAGVLVLEVGAQWQALEQAFPGLPFTWLEFEHGGCGVAMLQAADLAG